MLKHRDFILQVTREPLKHFKITNDRSLLTLKPGHVWLHTEGDLKFVPSYHLIALQLTCWKHEVTAEI